MAQLAKMGVAEAGLAYQLDSGIVHRTHVGVTVRSRESPFFDLFMSSTAVIRAARASGEIMGKVVPE